MTIHLLIVITLAVALVALLRGRWIQVDLFLLWFVALLVLGFAATQPVFVNWLGSKLGILYAPIAVIFLVMFLLVGILVTLTVFVTRLRSRQAAIVLYLAARELDSQEPPIGAPTPSQLPPGGR